MPNEVEMNGFLFSILKQMDLKNVDWETVARDRAITNGHAARMRFSRFKSAQEGREAKPRKPRAPRDPTTPRGAKARASAKKSKPEKDKKKEKAEPFTPPATPIKSDFDNDEMAIDNMPLSSMDLQRPLPTEPASFTIKSDPEMHQEVLQEVRFVKTEPDVASETSLESADFGQAVDMLGQVNIDSFSRPHVVYHVPSNHVASEMMTPRAMRTPEMCPPSPESLKRGQMTSELLAPVPVRRFGLPDRELFHHHYSNGMPIPVTSFGMGSGGGKDLGGFEEHMSGYRSGGGDMVMVEGGEPVVKEEQRWDDSY